MSDLVTFERRGAIGVITVDNPPVNALSPGVPEGLVDCVTQGNADPRVKAMVLRGAGRSFIAGADIKEFLERDMSSQEALEEDWIVTKVISNLSKPVIAMIDGFCLGGGLEIAMACDLRIASDRSKLGQPEINLGIIPGAGGTQRLTRLIGEGRAMEMILTGRMITAEEACNYGILNFTYSAEELEIKTMEIANTIASKSPYAIERAKRSVKAVSQMNLEKGLKLEREMFIECANSEDGKEGITAFIEKRKPDFKGR